MRYGLEEAKKQLLEQVTKAMAAPLPVESFPSAFRYRIPLVDMDPLAWLLGQESERKVYYVSDDGGLVVAGIGAAFEVSSDGWYGMDDIWGQLQALMNSCPEARVFVGMSFARVLSGVEWDGFGAVRCLLPALEIVKDENGCWLTVNMVRGRDGEAFDTGVADMLKRTCLVDDCSRSDVLIVAREDIPDYEDWLCSSEAVMDAFTREDLFKVVLARRVSLDLGGDSLPTEVFRKLLHPGKGKAVFLFSIDGKVFLSMRMDSLYMRRKTIVSSCVAMQDGVTEARQKSRAQQVVTGAVIEVYREFCRSYQIDCLQGDGIQAGRVCVSGDLNEGVTDKDFIQALCPTASVCGVPAEKARHFLQQYEIFDRGWFSGPSGFLSKDSVALAVSLEACLVDEGGSVHVFVGVPFFKDAEALGRWEDAGQRIRKILDVVHGIQA